LSITLTIIWQQILLAASVISATLPTSKSFLVSLSARWGEADPTGYGTSETATGAIELNGINSSRPNNSQPNMTEPHARKGLQGATKDRDSPQAIGDAYSRPSTAGGSQKMAWNVVSS